MLDIRQHDAQSALAQCFGERKTYTARGSRYDRDLPIGEFHRITPLHAVAAMPPFQTRRLDRAETESASGHTFRLRFLNACRAIVQDLLVYKIRQM
jgi:hypothetical protein